MSIHHAHTTTTNSLITAASFASLPTRQSYILDSAATYHARLNKHSLLHYRCTCTHRTTKCSHPLFPFYYCFSFTLFILLRGENDTLGTLLSLTSTFILCVCATVFGRTRFSLLLFLLFRKEWLVERQLQRPERLVDTNRLLVVHYALKMRMRIRTKEFSLVHTTTIHRHDET